MDIITYALCKKLIANSIAALGDVFDIKGTVATKEDLPMSGNKNGDVYLVGPQKDGSYNEYFWSSFEQWESMGSTATNLDGAVTEEKLYKGEDKTGTITEPAEGTILYEFKTLINGDIDDIDTELTNLREDFDEMNELQIV